MTGGTDQSFGPDPVAVRQSDHYRQEYIEAFVDKWDELIDWDLRAKGEGDFFCRLLRQRGARRVLDVATGTGFHSVRLLMAGFEVVSVDGSEVMLGKAVDNAKRHGLTLTPVQADWRRLSRQVEGKFDAIICLGNSFTHLFSEEERQRALREFRNLLKDGGVLIIDQRNYDAILDDRYTNRRVLYCGQNVLVEPEYVDPGLARFKYAFADDTVYHLNMFPLRNGYLRDLIRDAGFDPITTYGDFETEYDENESEFFIHVAEKRP